MTLTNERHFLYLEEHDAKINAKELYDSAYAVLSAYDGNATKEQAVKAMINLFIDELQENQTRDLMPPNRPNDAPKADKLVNEGGALFD